MLIVFFISYSGFNTIFSQNLVKTLFCCYLILSFLYLIVFIPRLIYFGLLKTLQKTFKDIIYHLNFIFTMLLLCLGVDVFLKYFNTDSVPSFANIFTFIVILLFVTISFLFVPDDDLLVIKK